VGFWEAPFSRWDSMFQSGVRAHYISSVYAAQLMIPNQSGLIVNLSFFAAQRADKGVAYGAAKAATDHMNSCMAHELKPNNIAALCIYPGLVRTEAVLRGADHLDLTNSESPQFIGRAVVALAEDENCMAKSGTVCIAAELALEYGFTDIDGSQPKPLSAMDI
jgi:dehydrogenase/reductase SDR family protein 1